MFHTEIGNYELAKIGVSPKCASNVKLHLFRTNSACTADRYERRYQELRTRTYVLATTTVGSKRTDRLASTTSGDFVDPQRIPRLPRDCHQGQGIEKSHPATL